MVGMVLALSTAFATASGVQAQPAESGPVSEEILAPAVSKKSGEEVGSFEGTLEVERFKARGDTLYAIGKVTGDVTRDNGTTTREVTRSVKLPVQSAQAGSAGEPQALQAQQESCEVLDLDLGPLDLDLLGLVVELDEVNLDIIAEPGEGNLLGNLLCAVAGLLDPGASPALLGIVEDLLNEILSILEGA